jgi:hypothetical protein
VATVRTISRWCFWLLLYLPLVAAFAVGGLVTGFGDGLIEGHQAWLRGWRVVSRHPRTWMQRKAIREARR